MDGEMEHVYMHTTTKGGDTYTLDLGMRDRISATAYITNAFLEHRLLKVAPDTYVHEDAIALIKFERLDVH